MADAAPVQDADVKYEVVGGADVGGAPVREGRSLTSKPLGKLGVGAVVSVAERAGERLRFQKLRGHGPAAGWVSARLLARAPRAREAEPGYLGSSLLANAEAAVEERGAERAAADAAAAGQDGAALVAAAVAQLTLGRARLLNGTAGRSACHECHACDVATAMGHPLLRARQLDGRPPGRTSEALATAARAKAGLSGDRDGLASCALLVAAARLAAGDGAGALAAASEASGLFEELGDRQMVASALTSCANARLLLRDAPAAQRAARDALAAFRALGDAPGAAAARSTLADAYATSQGPDQVARALLTDDLAHHRARGDKKGEAAVLLAQARGALAPGVGRGAAREAVARARRAARLLEEVGDRAGAASALEAAASGLLMQGDAAEEALAVAQEALAASRSAGNRECQVGVLSTLSSVHLARGQPDEARSNAEACQRLCRELGDKRSEARALVAAASASLAAGDAAAALEQAGEAASACRREGDGAGEARARHAAAQALASSRRPAAAAEAAREAAGLFRRAGDAHGEASALVALASLLLGGPGGAAEAVRCAERGRQLFLVLGDAPSQARAALLAAQALLLAGDAGGAASGAMQAVVLARDADDRPGEAQALYTAARAAVALGRHADAMRIAHEVEALFRALGCSDSEEVAAGLRRSIQRTLQAKVPSPTMRLRPAGGSPAGLRSLVQDSPNCIVWAPAISQQTYLMYCLELLQLVEELKGAPAKAQLLCAAQGVHSRLTGEPVPTRLEGVYGMSMWAVVRTIRLESPRLQITCCDLPAAATACEVAECLRCAMSDAGARGEVSYIVDRQRTLT
ncbi:unnamed protein product [Prorocentrum cordatum]|uniref:SH3 domain-containing protein n=1 Tax=Prorocentrum cordatum TaxID=2364126 RepID=A0ABN9T2W5_9DINO|nr:unnamed protein product [Polarella glacialis]